MEVLDALAGVGTDVRHEPVARRAAIGGGCPQRAEETAEQIGIGGREIRRGRDVPPRDGQQVHGCLRVDVAEHDHEVVLSHDIGRYVARRNTAEEAVSHREERTPRARAASAVVDRGEPIRDEPERDPVGLDDPVDDAEAFAVKGALHLG